MGHKTKLSMLRSVVFDEGLQNARVRGWWWDWAKKTKRFHCLNFALHFRGRRFTWGWHWPYVWRHRLYITGSGGRTVDFIGFEPIFLMPSIKIKLFKRLQIAVICVYLRKISEYEEDQMHHRPLDREAQIARFRLNRGHISSSNPGRRGLHV